MTDLKYLATMQETAQALGISRTKVYALIDDGKLVRVHIYGRALVTIESIEAYVASLIAEQLDLSGKAAA